MRKIQREADKYEKAQKPRPTETRVLPVQRPGAPVETRHTIKKRKPN